MPSHTKPRVQVMSAAWPYHRRLLYGSGSASLLGFPSKELVRIGRAALCAPP